MSNMTVNAILAQRPKRQPYIDGPEEACCQWQHGVDDRPNNDIVMHDEAHDFTVASVYCRLYTGKPVWRIKPVQFFFNVIPEAYVAGWRICRPFLCQHNGHFLERQFFDISREPEATADIVKLIFCHAWKFARQQFAICIHKLRPWVMNINVLPAPSDQSRQTSWSENVLPVSGIITLATACLAPFTFLYGLLVYSAISTVFWQHFHLEVCHG